MNIRKRVKIKVQSSDRSENSIDAKKLNRARLSLFRDDEDEDDSVDELPTRALKKKKEHPPKLPSVEGQPQTNYSDLFIRKHVPARVAEQVLNLEDMAQDDYLSQDQDDDVSVGFPGKEEIEEIKARRLVLQRNLRVTGKNDEKDYVSLLDKDDKQEIMNTIERQGGGEEEPQDLELTDDERLPLSSREAILKDAQRKQAITDALSIQDKEASDKWETQLLSKGSGHLQRPTALCALPRPYFSDSDENEDLPDTDEISQRIASISFRQSQLGRQIDALKSQKHELQQEQDALTHRLLQWPLR